MDLHGLERDVADARARLAQGLTTEQDVNRALQRLEAASRTTHHAAGSAPLIDTSFVMDPGETVVVGTSRLEGGRALIVLLTAAAK